MKLKTAVLIFICMITFALTGCSKKDEELNPKRPIELTVWHYYSGMQKRSFDNVVKKFNDTVGLEKGVYISAVGYGSVANLTDAVLAAAEGELDAGSLPDLFTGYAETMIPMYQMDMLVDLETYFTEAELDAFIDIFMDMKVAYDGKIMSLPVARSTEFGMLNKTDFDIFMDAAGLAAGLSYDDLYTFEGIWDIAGEYYQWSGGKSFYGINSVANLANGIAAQMGQDEGLISLAGGEPQAAYTEVMMQKIWQFYYEGIVRGYCNPDGRALSKQNSGEVLYLLTPTINTSNFPQTIHTAGRAPYGAEMMALPMPYVKGGGKKALQLGGGVAIIKGEKKAEQGAALFLKWLTEDGNNGEFAVHSSGYMPVKKADMENMLDITREIIERQEEGYNTLYEQRENILKGTENYIGMFEEYDLVFASVYSQSRKLSNLLNQLTSQAVEARENVVKELSALPETASASDYEEMINKYCSTNKFKQWYMEFHTEVTRIIGGVEE